VTLFLVRFLRASLGEATLCIVSDGARFDVSRARTLLMFIPTQVLREAVIFYRRVTVELVGRRCESIGSTHPIPANSYHVFGAGSIPRLFKQKS
jgi:hypothetical protein